MDSIYWNFHAACEAGSLAQVQKFINRGDDINVKNKECKTPLHIACSQGHLRTAILLINSACDVNQKDNDGCSVLHIICSLRSVSTDSLYIKLADILINKVNNINDVNIEGWTPLHFACYYDNPKCVAKLLKQGSDCKVKTIYGQTPMYFACQQGHVSCIETMLACKKVNPNDELEDQGMRAIHIATIFGHLNIIKLLSTMLDKVNINAKTDLGMTASLLSVKFGHSEILETLIQLGSDIPEDEINEMLSIAYGNQDFKSSKVLKRHKQDLHESHYVKFLRLEKPTTDEVRNCEVHNELHSDVCVI